MTTTVGRLRSFEPPPRVPCAILDGAGCSEIDQESARYVALMVGAYSGRNVGERTPRRLS